MGRDNKRRYKRTEWKRPGQIISLVGQPIINCIVQDISAAGARLAVPVPDVVPDYFVLHYGSEQVKPKCRVRWRHGNELGVEFYTRSART
jgi:hypothetical protein